MSDRTKKAYENWAPTYDTDPNAHTALQYHPLLDSLAARRGEKVLDAACGTGRHTAALHAGGVEDIGLDFSPAMLAVARLRLPGVRLIEADLRYGRSRCCAGRSAVTDGTMLTVKRNPLDEIPSVSASIGSR